MSVTDAKNAKLEKKNKYRIFPCNNPLEIV
ncbi:hypothetical protein EZS27_010849 [termite gut metagenome]|uniref:Uncharacterized protein n=1 Tax=termite gut metagenome TaxID=433724 RepID=A0A5J4S7I4_9ZZZZ